MNEQSSKTTNTGKFDELVAVISALLDRPNEWQVGDGNYTLDHEETEIKLWIANGRAAFHIHRPVTVDLSADSCDESWSKVEAIIGTFDCFKARREAERIQQVIGPVTKYLSVADDQKI